MNRRQFLGTTGVTLSAAAIGAPYVSTGRAQGAPPATPIRIGVMAPLTGVAASGGREMVEGTQFWFEQIRGEISGRKVELLVEDDASNPDVALQKALVDGVCYAIRLTTGLGGRLSGARAAVVFFIVVRHIGSLLWQQ